MRVIFGFLACLCIWTPPMSAIAAVNFDVEAYALSNRQEEPALNYLVRISGYDLDNNHCFGPNPRFTYKEKFTAVTVNPPFSGESTRVRYVSFCKTGIGSEERHFFTLKLKLRLYDCSAWICRTETKVWVVRSSVDPGYLRLRRTKPDAGGYYWLKVEVP